MCSKQCTLTDSRIFNGLQLSITEDDVGEYYCQVEYKINLPNSENKVKSNTAKVYIRS